MTKVLRNSARSLAGALGLKPLWHRFLEWRAAQASGDVPATDEQGVALPPALLMATVVGHADWREFVESGRRDLAAFKDAVERHGGDFANARRILDFGCGSGRLARHLPAATGAEIFGVDYNPGLARWCARNLKGAFERNGGLPPLDFPDGHFDILYALSVFTHQRLPTQNAWLSEFARVLAPRGSALVTFHDEDHPAAVAAGLSKPEIERQGFIVHNDAAEGSNFMAAFQSRDHMARQAAAQFDVLDLIETDRNPLGQTIAVLRRR